MSPPREQMITKGLHSLGSPEEHFLEGLKSTTSGRSLLWKLANAASKVIADGYFNSGEERNTPSSSALQV